MYTQHSRDNLGYFLGCGVCCSGSESGNDRCYGGSLDRSVGILCICTGYGYRNRLGIGRPLSSGHGCFLKYGVDNV
jgi:hypothetical protein